MNVIEVKNLKKSFRGKPALNDVSFSVSSGVIFGLLGPNGAGKTTLVKTVLDLTRSDEGEALLNGSASTNEGSRQGVAYMPEKFNFFPYYTVEGVVEFYGQMQGVKGAELKAQVTRSLERLNIVDIRKQKIKGLSKGQLQRTGLAGNLMGENSLVILDEPFSGLDPIGIKELKDLILELKAEGKTIFINSHILAEVEKLCEEIVIMNKGKVVSKGKISELTAGKTLEEFFYEVVKK